MGSLYFHIMLGLGLLLIGIELIRIGVADGIRTFLKPDIRLFLQTYKLAKRRTPYPILLEGWNLPRA